MASSSVIFAPICFGRQHVTVVVALGAHEGAELAVDVADVRVVDVPVDDVGDDLVAVAAVGRALALAAARVGQFAEFGQRREIELLRLLGRDASAVEYTQDGNLILFVVNDHGQLRSYRVDRIAGIRPTTATFQPMFRVKF